MGFIVSILLFAQITKQMQGILLGAVIIVVLGVVDDITPLPAMTALALSDSTPTTADFTLPDGTVLQKITS